MNPAPLLFLARHLPRRAARPLGGAWGRLAADLYPGRRRRAEETLRRFFPDLDAGAVSRLARRSFARHGAALGEVAAVARLDARRLCRHLRLAGWNHLDEAAGHGRGVLLFAPRIDLWRLAVLAVGLYREPLAIAGALAGDPLLGRLAGRFERRLGHSVLEEIAAEGAARRLADGGCLAVLGELPMPGETAASTHLAAPSALATGAPVVPIFGRPEAGGGYRIVAQPPIDSDDPEDLARRCGQAAAAEARSRPEGVAWWKMNDA